MTDSIILFVSRAPDQWMTVFMCLIGAAYLTYLLNYKL